MHLGLLLCDHIPQEFQHHASDFPDFFAAWLPEGQWTIFPVCDGQFPESPEVCDAWICSGSRASVYDDEPWIHQLKAFVRDIAAARKPYVGICFGHQMLALALGGRVSRSPHGWCVGVHRFELEAPESWMGPAQPQLNLLISCQDQVMALPPHSVVLGRNPDCPIAIFRTGAMLGIQPHPEFSPGYVESLVRSRVERIGKEKSDIALASLSNPLDARVLGEWVSGFLRERLA
ncbi:MAG: amidotransferase [Bacteroidetes bacterium]|nr:MAG: amidotransferase [Bacteroidota bacterium]